VPCPDAQFDPIEIDPTEVDLKAKSSLSTGTSSSENAGWEPSRPVPSVPLPGIPKRILQEEMDHDGSRSKKEKKTRDRKAQQESLDAASNPALEKPLVAQVKKPRKDAVPTDVVIAVSPEDTKISKLCEVRKAVRLCALQLALVELWNMGTPRVLLMFFGWLIRQWKWKQPQAQAKNQIGDHHLSDFRAVRVYRRMSTARRGL
jgi:hypothetical protein